MATRKQESSLAQVAPEEEIVWKEGREARESFKEITIPNLLMNVNKHFNVDDSATRKAH